MSVLPVSDMKSPPDLCLLQVTDVAVVGQVAVSGTPVVQVGHLVIIDVEMEVQVQVQVLVQVQVQMQVQVRGRVKLQVQVHIQVQ